MDTMPVFTHLVKKCFITETISQLPKFILGINFLQTLFQPINFLLFCQSRNLFTKLLGSKTKMALQNLSDIHTRGDAEWVENDVYCCSVGKEGYVLLR